MWLCLHAGNSITWMGSPGSLPADATKPPAPRPSPLVQEDELLSNNHLPEHNNIVSAPQLITRIVFTFYITSQNLKPRPFPLSLVWAHPVTVTHTVLLIYGICFISVAGAFYLFFYHFPHVILESTKPDIPSLLLDFDNMRLTLYWQTFTIKSFQSQVKWINSTTLNLAMIYENLLFCLKKKRVIGDFKASGQRYLQKSSKTTNCCSCLWL